MSTIEEDTARYLRAMHAVQSGIAMEHARGSDDGTPKHLRVGITSGQIADAALAGLLIQKGILTLDEYVAAQAVQAEAEVARYEARLSETLGTTVKLS